MVCPRCSLMPSQNSSGKLILVRPNPGSNGSSWPSGSKNRFDRVGLTSQRVQIWVQPYNVLNKPNLNPTQPVFSWALMVQNRVELGQVGWGHFAALVSALVSSQIIQCIEYRLYSHLCKVAFLQPLDYNLKNSML